VCPAYAGHTQAVWRNGGFSAFLEAKVLNRNSGIFSNFGTENPPLRQAAGTLAVTIKKSPQNLILYQNLVYLFFKFICHGKKHINTIRRLF
jgi:hypothetical protein